MEELIQEVIKASNRGVSASKNATGGPNWSLGQSLFFSCTLITTIGKFLESFLQKGVKKKNKNELIKF